jgi:hypothetical protein
LLQQAEQVLVDAATDGIPERRLLNNFVLAGLRPGALIVVGLGAWDGRIAIVQLR